MLPRAWQKINVACHLCHWWRDTARRRLAAMTYLMIFAVVAVLLSAETVRLALRDGRGPQRPPRSHPDDVRFHSPAVPH